MSSPRRTPDEALRLFDAIRQFHSASLPSAEPGTEPVLSPSDRRKEIVKWQKARVQRCIEEEAKREDQKRTQGERKEDGEREEDGEPEDDDLLWLRLIRMVGRGSGVHEKNGLPDSEIREEEVSAYIHALSALTLPPLRSRFPEPPYRQQLRLIERDSVKEPSAPPPPPYTPVAISAIPAYREHRAPGTRPHEVGKQALDGGMPGPGEKPVEGTNRSDTRPVEGSDRNMRSMPSLPPGKSSGRSIGAAEMNRMLRRSGMSMFNGERRARAGTTQFGRMADVLALEHGTMAAVVRGRSDGSGGAPMTPKRAERDLPVDRERSGKRPGPTDDDIVSSACGASHRSFVSAHLAPPPQPLFPSREQSRAPFFSCASYVLPSAS